MVQDTIDVICIRKDLHATTKIPCAITKDPVQPKE